MAARSAPPYPGLIGTRTTLPGVPALSAAPHKHSAKEPVKFRDEPKEEAYLAHRWVKPPQPIDSSVYTNNNSGQHGVVWRKPQWSYLKTAPELGRDQKRGPFFDAHHEPPTGVGRDQPVGIASLAETPVDQPLLPLPDNFDVSQQSSGFVPYY